MVQKRKKSMEKVFDDYRKFFDYIQESRKFIFLSIFIFIFFSLFGYFFQVPDFISSQIIKLITEIIEKTKDMSQMDMTIFIFLNNLKSSFFGMIFGVFLGIFPIFLLIVNGFLLGFVASLSVSSEGILSLWKVFPHGIFELPAVFISLGLGIRLGAFIFEKNKRKLFKYHFLNSLRVFLFIVIPLLFIAAVLEGILIFIFK